MKLFETRTAPNPRRVRIFLAEKGLLDDVEFIQLDLQKGENLTPEFVARNPMKKVPVLDWTTVPASPKPWRSAVTLKRPSPTQHRLWVATRWKRRRSNNGCAG